MRSFPNILQASPLHHPMNNSCYPGMPDPIFLSTRTLTSDRNDVLLSTYPQPLLSKAGFKWLSYFMWILSIK